MFPSSNPRDIGKLHSKKLPGLSPNRNQACIAGCDGTRMGGIQATLSSMGTFGLRDWQLNVGVFLCLWRRLMVEGRKK